jgi:hypothetical protein
MFDINCKPGEAGFTCVLKRKEVGPAGNERRANIGFAEVAQERKRGKSAFNCQQPDMSCFDKLSMSGLPTLAPMTKEVTYCQRLL